jgi:hypothetical protein
MNRQPRDSLLRTRISGLMTAELAWFSPQCRRQQSERRSINVSLWKTATQERERHLEGWRARLVASFNAGAAGRVDTHRPHAGRSLQRGTGVAPHLGQAMGHRQRGRLALARAGVVALAVASGFAALGCAHRMGEQASAGMMSGLRDATTEAIDTPPDRQISRVMAGRAVAGALETLETPEQRARLQALIAAVVDSATRAAVAGVSQALEGATEAAIEGMTTAVGDATRAAVDSAARQLVTQLGPSGEGPLGQSLTRTGAVMSAAVVGGVMSGAGDHLGALAPACDGADPFTCIERRLGSLAQTTGAGFAAGVAKSIRWPLLMFDFLAGAVAGVFVAWLWSLRHHRVRRFQAA